MSMDTNHQDDLDLLLSLDDRVLETPPASPSGYLSDDGSSRRKGKADMSVFRDAVQDCLDYDTETAKKAVKSNINKSSDNFDVDKFSGLRIRNQLVSPLELSNRLSDIRFVRLSAIKNLLKGDTLSGCWATIGVLTEKGIPRNSTTGKTYSIWKLGCLDEKTISVFLFGDAYTRNRDEKLGTVFTLFNCSVRKDKSDHGFSLSVFNATHILKLGTSMDYGVCKGKRSDGMACTLIINKRHGTYCSYHRKKTSDKYSVSRGELKGGNLNTAFKPFKREGIYAVSPKSTKNAPIKLLSVDALKNALSNAGKVTTNVYSQGIRFLTEVTGSGELEAMKKSSAKRPSSSQGSQNHDLRTKKMKVDQTQTRVKQSQKPSIKKSTVEQTGGIQKKGGEKMIELDIISSDDDL